MPKTKHVVDEPLLETPPVEKVAPAVPVDLDHTLNVVRAQRGLEHGIRSLMVGLNAQINAALADQHLSAETLDKIDQTFLEVEARNSEIVAAVRANALDVHQ